MLDKTIIDLRKKGYSYAELSKISGETKRVIHRIVKGVSFSEEGMIRRQKELTGITKNIKPQQIKISPQKTRIIAHLMFDGTIFKLKYHRVMRYINSSRELINQFTQDVYEIYGLMPSAFEELEGKTSPVFKVTFYSKEMYEDLLKYSSSYSTSKTETSIPELILKGNRDVKIEFLRAFWEDEGSISAVGRIMADLKSERVIKQIIVLQEERGLSFKLILYHKDNKELYKIYLPKSLENLEKFQDLNLFGNSIITHGVNSKRRKEDVLKEHIEKLKNHANQLISRRP